MLVNLAADLTGQALGALLDPFLWFLMIVAALRLRMRWIVPAAIVVSLLIEVGAYLIEPPELKATRFTAYTLIGRAIAGVVIGVVARRVIDRRAKQRMGTLSPPPPQDA